MGITEILDCTVPANRYHYVFLYMFPFTTHVCVYKRGRGGTVERVKREVFGTLVFH